MTSRPAPSGPPPPSEAPARWRERLRWARLRWARLRSAFAGLWRQGTEIELMQRAMGFAALGLVTLVPLLIVVAAALPQPGQGFAHWVVDGMGLANQPAGAVQKLFSAPRRVLSATSAFSAVALGLFGLSFASSVQTGYEKIWRLTVGPLHRIWRQSVWLAVLTAYVLAEAESGSVLRHGWLEAAARIAGTLLIGILFFWWSQRFLLRSRVGWRVLLPGAVATMAGLVGLRAFSSLVFSPLIVSSAVTYGAVGTVLVVQSWLIGVGYVMFGGALVGRHLNERPTLEPAEQPADDPATGPPAAPVTEPPPDSEPAGAVAGRTG